MRNIDNSLYEGARIFNKALVSQLTQKSTAAGRQKELQPALPQKSAQLSCNKK